MPKTFVKNIEAFPIAIPPTGFGADPKNINPVYAAAILRIETTNPLLTGNSFVFTIGHGTVEMCGMIRSAAQRFLLQSPLNVDDLAEGAELGNLSRRLLGDSDYNWLGGAGMSRMAIGAVVNALWDLCAKHKQTTGWEYLAQKSPEDLVQFIDFEHIGDFLSPAEVLELLHKAQSGKQSRIEHLYRQGPVAYNTAGWSGISDAGLAAKTREMLARNWTLIKIKVGAKYPAHGMEVAVKEDIARLTKVFDTIHESHGSMQVAVDSNQIFNVTQAVQFIARLAAGLDSAGNAKGAGYRLAWFEEPTSPLDSQGHLMIKHQLTQQSKERGVHLDVPIATGEHCPAPVLFKNLVQGLPDVGVAPIDIIQIDYSRMGGIGDLLASILMACKANVRICPHAGGIGLCEAVVNVQALKQALFGERGDLLEFVEGGLHEGVYRYPASVKDAHYVLHRGPIGNGTELTPEAEATYSLPSGTEWQKPENRGLAAQLARE